MKLVRYGRPGKEKPGLIDDEGKLRDLSGVIDDIGPEQLSDKALRKLAKIPHADLPLVRGNPRFGVPVAKVELPSAEGFKQWKAGLVKQLREKCFRALPEKVPAVYPSASVMLCTARSLSWSRVMTLMDCGVSISGVSVLVAVPVTVWFAPSVDTV